MAEVFAADEQGGDTGHRLDVARWARLADAVLTAEGTGTAAELSLLFVDSDAMSELNSRFRGTEGPTDVLAFPMDEVAPSLMDLDSGRDDELGPTSGDLAGRYPDGGTTGPVSGAERPDTSKPPLVVGDVVICPEVAAGNAPGHFADGHDGGLDDELALLVVHGVLHLLGMDHMETAEAEEMEAKEQDLLSRFHRRPQPGRSGTTETEMAR